ncbi:MAG: PilT/PilU family type 4a pilus ATPase [Deltaproteobacteria bacterium]|nr:PilT/PilU family type 4a pilus ATPase [Deltaproteobacteria bacterium]
MNFRIDRFLKLMNDRGASDLHFSVGRPPHLRQRGEMVPIRYRRLTQHDYEELFRPLLTPEKWEDYSRTGDLDFAYELKDVARYRVNLFKQEFGGGAVLRIIPTKILTVEELGLPKVVLRLTKIRSGLTLVTGPTGSGKSTTLSALINEINRTKRYHIITLEDPIEFVHGNIRSIITQREMGAHAIDFNAALKAAVRENPDCVLVGEMRDRETIRLALQCAEKGLLVFGTLHTNSAGKTIDRIINVFPSDEQESVRAVLGEVIRGIVAQQLLPKVGGGRCAAIEVLFGSPALGAIIREGKTNQITSYIQTGRGVGMVAMDETLRRMVEEGLVTGEAAFEKAIDKEGFHEWLEKRGEAGVAEERAERMAKKAIAGVATGAKTGASGAAARPGTQPGAQRPPATATASAPATAPAQRASTPTAAAQQPRPAQLNVRKP